MHHAIGFPIRGANGHDKGISARYVILSIPLPAGTILAGEIVSDDDVSKQFLWRTRRFISLDL